MAETPKRRYTDHIKQTSDHDLLIKLHTKFDANCEKLKEYHDKVDARELIMDARCEKRYDKIIGKPFFMWVVGFVILGLITVAANTGWNTTSIMENRIKVIENKEHIEENKFDIDLIKELVDD